MAVIGLDAGGTGSRAVLVADSGRVLATVRGSAASAALPEARLAAALSDLLRPLSAAHRTGEAVGVLAGFAGAGRPEPAARARHALQTGLGEVGLRAGRVAVVTDADIALSSVAPESEGPAAVLLAGTGSIALAGAAGGAGVSRAGGWGRHLDDEGGGFWLGRRALEMAARAVDGRCPDGGPLAQALLSALGLTGWDHLVEAAPELWAEPARMAALAPVVLHLAAAGDAAAGALLRQAGQALAALLLAARAAARLASDAPTGLAGGLWREPGGGLRQALREALPPAIDRTCRPLAVPPAVGAACRLLAPGPRRRLIAAMSGTEG